LLKVARSEEVGSGILRDEVRGWRMLKKSWKLDRNEFLDCECINIKFLFFFNFLKRIKFLLEILYEKKIMKRLLICFCLYFFILN